MPTQTFFNLPDEKRMLLIEAAKKEFSRVPLYEASISNIIKEADIARGSFYQYFADKEDLYFYLLQKDAETRRNQFLDYLKECNGDLFHALFKVLQSMLAELERDSVKKLYRNVFLNMNYKTEKTFMYNKMDEEINQYMLHIKRYIDTSELNLIKEKDLTYIVHISSSVILQNVINKFALNLTNEEVLHSFQQQLDLLKRGFKKS